ncbi:sodium:solute symporter family protein [Tamaricihabitans halophyticus]|uniref:Sodium:solute symporter family protein n=1 Tax=Tamaricihabitans halophyticus TaxID=1262583 RepID=A0A4V2SUR4_9PSEU|nr:cation acetate symporter [Tamaricihabitans halophyticus]TCP55306.1 sodium:solute symporter family protein [Tamaricihabitans halophyticus]
MFTVIAVAPVVLVTLLIGLRGVAAMRTTSDFLVASRGVSPLLNSAAVSGEYLSAASFLGVAGLMVKDGVGALWYPVGFAAGYLVMLVLVAAPMRRSGAVTVPDFVEARLASPALRRLAAIVVLMICALYLVPQFRTAGLVLMAISDTPYWVGVVIAGASVSATLALGGMRAATYVQAFQFVLKLVLFIVPALWLVLQTSAATQDEALRPVGFTEFATDTPVSFENDVVLRIPTATTVQTDDGQQRVLPAGTVQVAEDETLHFPQGAQVPRVQGLPELGGSDWSGPLLNLRDAGYPMLGTIAVLLATVLGTMGLPHVLMRFHTSSDGRAARRTAAFTVVLLGLFYLFPAIYGALGRVLVPELYLSGMTDSVVVALPARVDPSWVGTMFTALLTAGAFAAFLATSLGLLLALSGAISHDLVPGGLRQLRITVVLAAVVVVLLAFAARQLDAGILVTWGFTVAAATFCPLLVLGIWWSRLTATGAIWGVLVGLGVTSTGILITLFGPAVAGWLGILAAQPAPLAVPLAFLTMVLVSLRGRPPSWAMTAMLRLHLDERHDARPGRSLPGRSRTDRSTWLTRRWSTARRKGRRLVR